MARRLFDALQGTPGLSFLREPQVNSVFAFLPEPAIARLHAQGWRFYQFIAGGGCRFMCSWDTTFEDCDQLAADVAEELSAEK